VVDILNTAKKKRINYQKKNQKNLVLKYKFVLLCNEEKVKKEENNTQMGILFLKLYIF